MYWVYVEWLAEEMEVGLLAGSVYWVYWVNAKWSALEIDVGLLAGSVYTANEG